MPSTTANLLKNLEAILHEITTMENTVRKATITENDRRRLRWEISELRHRADNLMNWLSEQRLEETKH